MKIGVVNDKIKGLWRSMTTEELEQAVKEEVRPNRSTRRAWWVRTRRKGPGYTRALSKGRTQRPEEDVRPRRIRVRPLTPEQDLALRTEGLELHRRRVLREERRQDVR